MKRRVTLEISGRAPLFLRSLKEGEQAFRNALQRPANRIRDIVLLKDGEPRFVSYANFHDVCA